MATVPALLVPGLWTELGTPGSAILVVASVATLAIAAGRVAAVRRRRPRADDLLDLLPPVPEPAPVPAPPGRVFEVPPARLATIALEHDVPELAEASPRLAGLLQRLSTDPEALPGPEERPVPLHAVLEGVLQELEPLAAERGLTVEVADAGVPGEVLRGEASVRRGLHELLLNALDFAPDGSRVRVRLADLGLRGAVVVEDQGDGLGCQELARVFPSIAERRPDGPWGIELPGAGRLEFRPGGGEGSCLRLAVPVFSTDREPHLHWL